MTKKVAKGTQKQTIARKDGKIIVMLTLDEFSSHYTLNEWDAEEHKTIVERRYEKKDYKKALSDYDLLQTIILNTSFDEITENVTESYRFVKLEDGDAD